jgi:NAD+ diphosphatase
MTSPRNGRPCPHDTGDFLRLGEERRDRDLVDRLADAPDALFFPIRAETVLVRDEPVPCPALLDRSQAAPFLAEPPAPGSTDAPVPPEAPLLLGFWQERPVFGLDLTDIGPDDPGLAGLAGAGQFRELRSLFPLISQDELQFFGLAKSLLQWRRRARFCGVCGSATRPAEGGHVRLCSNPACGAPHYPRTDPAVILLLTRDSGREGLFVHQPTWPKRMYALVAGYVEPGESLEEAAARETLEETALVAGNFRYVGSRPWPFPGTVMLAFAGEILSGDLTLPGSELDDGFFLSREALRAAVLDQSIRLPSKHSMAFSLIEEWFDAGGLGPLRPLNPY